MFEARVEMIPETVFDQPECTRLHYSWPLVEQTDCRQVTRSVSEGSGDNALADAAGYLRAMNDPG